MADNSGEKQTVPFSHRAFQAGVAIAFIVVAACSASLLLFGDLTATWAQALGAAAIVLPLVGIAAVALEARAEEGLSEAAALRVMELRDCASQVQRAAADLRMRAQDRFQQVEEASGEAVPLPTPPMAVDFVIDGGGGEITLDDVNELVALRDDERTVLALIRADKLPQARALRGAVSEARSAYRDLFTLMDEHKVHVGLLVGPGGPNSRRPSLPGRPTNDFK